MYFIYFSFALLSSIIVYLDSEKQQMPRWWAAVVFFAPAVVPYYIIKTRHMRGLLPLTVFIAIFILVGFGESLLYSRIKYKIIYSSYSPTAREILRLTDELKYSIAKLNSLTLQLDDMSRVDSSAEKIGEVLSFTGEMQSQMEKSIKSVRKFVQIIKEHRSSVINENFGWLLRIESYFNEPIIVKYIKNLSQYIDAFSALLKFTGENLKEIASKDQLAQKNYDGYYMDYVRALDSYTRIDVSRMQFQHDFLLHNPELEPYLLTILQKRFVNIWDKNQ